MRHWFAMATSLTIKVQRLLPAAQLPRYAHTGAFGDLAADVYAAEAVTLEPGKTVMLEKPKVLELADRYKIAIVGYEAAPTEPQSL